MEIGRGSEHQGHLLTELNQMREQVMEFAAHLGRPSLSEFCKHLAPKLLSSLEKSMSMAKTTSPGAQQQPRNTLVGADSPRVVGSPSPRGYNSDTDFRKDMSKKRKTTPKWTSQVRMAAGADGGMDDGCSWRKYGQKIILGAKHPRGYFRCTHRYTQSCKATKQVQRSDDDPLVFDVTYHGTHTCLHKPQPATAHNEQAQAPKPQQADQQQLLLLLQSFRTGLKVKTEDLLPEAFGAEGDSPVVSFSFEANKTGNGAADAMLDTAFCSPSTADNCFTGAPCASFFSPTITSDFLDFPASPFQANGFNGLGKHGSSELDLILPAAGSGCTSPEADLSFLQLEPLDLGLFDDDSCFFP